MFKKEEQPREIERQLSDFIRYRHGRSKSSAESAKEWLLIFINGCNKDHVFDVTEEDLMQFAVHIRGEYPRLLCIRGMKAVRQFLTFYRVPGRKILDESIDKLYQY